MRNLYLLVFVMALFLAAIVEGKGGRGGGGGRGGRGGSSGRWVVGVNIFATISLS